MRSIRARLTDRRVREHPNDADDQSLLWDCDHFDDHGPPRFHARHADGAAKVRIDTLEPIETTLGRQRLRLVLAWAELHQAELLENWRLARVGETLSDIEPLR